MSARLRHEVRLFFVALQFLTRLPVPARVGFEPEWLNRSVRHFPAVGALLGLLGAGVFVAAETLFTPTVAAWLSIATTVWLTGAFHEDGLADTADALGGNVGRERALEIMKDSRIGSYGAVGLLLVIGLGAATLAALAPGGILAPMVMGHAASRAAAVALMRRLPYAGDVGQAKARPLARAVSAGDARVAFAQVAVLALLLWLCGLAPALPMLSGLLAAGLGSVALARWYSRRLGGITGDTLGATQQISQLLLLLAWLAVQGPGPAG